MSPDWSAKEDPVPYAKLDNPQSLNLYGYVLNNPLGMADPDGHCCLEEAAQLLDEYGPSAVSATQTAFTATVGAIGALALKASGALDKVADAVAANPGSIQSGSWDVGQSYNHPEQRAENLGSGNAPAPSGNTGNYQPNPKHGPEQKGDDKSGVSADAKAGGSLMDKAVEVKPGSSVAVDHDHGNFVVYKTDENGQTHGYQTSWKGLRNDQRAALQKAGQVTQRGKIVPLPKPNQ